VSAILFWQWRVVDSVKLPSAITGWNSDLYTAYYPVHLYAYGSADFLPFWNPHQLVGTPFWGNANGILYPPNFAARFLGIGAALGLVCALHLGFAGLGTFLVARELSLSALAAGIAGVVFMLNLFMTSAFIHPSHLAGYAWVPWLFLAGGRLVATPGAKGAALLGICFAMQLLTGSSQMAVYSAYALLVAGLAYLAAAGPWETYYLTRLIASSVMAGIIGLMLAAAQIVPTVEVLLHAARGGLPVAATLPNAPDLRFVHAALVSGGPVVAAGVVALFDRRRRAVVLSGVVLLAYALLFGLGSSAYTHLFYYLPGVDRFRVPNRMLIVASFAMALLAAIGLDGLREARATRRRVRALFVVVVTTLVVAGGGVLAGKHASLVPSVSGTLILAGVTLVAIGGSGRLGQAAMLFLFGAVVLERYAQPPNSLMLPQHNEETFFAPPPFARFLAEQPGGDRVLVVPSARFPVMAKAGTLYGLNVVQDYEPLAPHEYQRFLEPLEEFNMDSPLFWGRVFPPPRDDLWRPLDMMATRYVVVQAGAEWITSSTERFQQIYEDSSVRIFENTQSLPRAYLVDNVEVESDLERALARTRDVNFNPLKAVVLDQPVESQSERVEPSLPVEVEVASVSPRELTLAVSTPRTAVLVLTDLFWPGWRAWVDGLPQPIYRANFLFRAVAVEAGVHEVRLRYEPWSILVGSVVSSATAVGLVAAFAWSWWKRRQDLRVVV
jgi:hypothetical protein